MIPDARKLNERPIVNNCFAAVPVNVGRKRNGRSGKESGPSAIGKADSVSGRRLALRPFSKRIETVEKRLFGSRVADDW